ncbi:bifunctional proline dehydrogenase/L-glutamate gamma-semialdehyde dehydrogenase PutA [Ahrensia sp. R2A130]|uniref:bifunctional proline dehydrogenase/L-glutamate gamma-semialdehyde dehydrogenase PutA n=1 Tax=Ahrensia sp. R2A130 TaxID=744979 RepID=UPI0001E0C355|nr:bifunctional proline dehydrogenase/L-glutamate gamma-semialdehyde dehydrogenase PutA [Ahrensia sp. R2A130]EFL89368.1 proline dehydrogenase/delta-1-pyrroline-5-carboxylate dehydrogenase [Ahrensia sp. R2A130]
MPIPAAPKSEEAALRRLLDHADIQHDLRARIAERAVGLVKAIRTDSEPGMMELFLAEYGLSSDEGVALMCLAEALLRVPDEETMDALIEDKIAPSQWGRHLGHSHSPLINASTWALYITGKVLDDSDENKRSVSSVLHGAIKRLGEPVIRQAVSRAMKEMGRQFVLGESIEAAVKRAKVQEKKGFTYSYDMLGEAAKTERDARRYHLSYSEAISEIAHHAKSEDIRENPGISIKLSALHPRYETAKAARVMDELVPRVLALAALAKSAGIGLNIDAEEAARLDLSIAVIEEVLSRPALKGWDGFGVVVQAYGRRAPDAIDWLHDLATRLDRRIMVRLVKGAYWDTEIKHAQVEGHDAFPVFTRKPSTDVSYICCAQKLLGMSDRIYPQFATHNAHTVAAILEMAAHMGKGKETYEFQRLHGMGEALHGTVRERHDTRCRIYAPVGAHKDLLAYLVRRLLENGANSSFVNQIVDEDVPPEDVAADPFERVETYLYDPASPAILRPADLFGERKNSNGEDLSDPKVLERLDDAISKFDDHHWSVGSGRGQVVPVTNPATGASVGEVTWCNEDDVAKAVSVLSLWSAPVAERAAALRRAADLYEANAPELFALLIREAGKTLNDCVGELREAVDFLRFYADEAEGLDPVAAGRFVCISPWNFPLAIFSGQIAAALAAGNAVLAKPAESTSIIAHRAVDLLHEAGVPKAALQLLPGSGREVGSALVSNPAIDGVCFTGSTATAKLIDRSMAEHLAPRAPLIAETGGLNAMIVDSTALPEQAITDIVASAFQSAGQRCSALRVLYVQADVAEGMMKMLRGAMDELAVGDPRDFATDVGPVIDEAARKKIADHIEIARAEGRLIAEGAVPADGTFIAPTILKVNSIADLEEEIFGPVLHVATFEAEEINAVVAAINATGYGLTFGLHTRIDDRVQHIAGSVEAGNIYVNRNQIGAVVGSQPFGGEGLSGTGPKAGGPLYLPRFTKQELVSSPNPEGGEVSLEAIEDAFAAVSVSAKPIEERTLPGPTGEANRWSLLPRGRVLCLGPSAHEAQQQVKRAAALGCAAIAVAPGVGGLLDGRVSAETLAALEDIGAVIDWSDDARDVRRALASRTGAIVPLVTSRDVEPYLVQERHICINTTAAGGNAELLGGEVPAVAEAEAA